MSQSCSHASTSRSCSHTAADSRPCSHCQHQETPGCIAIVPIFSGLTPDEMIEIALITRERTVDKGEIIYSAGDQVKRLYVLHTGRIKISRLSPSGKEQVIRVLGPGEFMGELSLFSPQPMTDNSEAMERTTMCLIEGSLLKDLMSKYPMIAFKIMEELSRRLEHAENLIEDINLHSVEYRLAQTLLKLANPQHVVLLKMTKGDFASQLGMSQETLSRKLTVFQDQDLITQIGQRKIILRDLEGLDSVI